MNITVAICTWNRSSLLQKTLEAMTKLNIPEGVQWQLLVVNNNCTDDTDEVLERFVDRLPLKRLFEPVPGQSNARNCAISEAGGELLVWTDDDVLVEPNWLAAYWHAACENPDESVFGGRVDPLWEAAPPDWVVANLDRLASTFALRQLDDGTYRFPETQIPIGANMATRRSVFQKYRFDPRLGNAGNNNLRGDDAEYLRRLEADGFTFLWVSEAAVQHFVPASRLTLGYVWDWFYGGGRSVAIRNNLPPVKHWWEVPKWMYRSYCQDRFRARLSARQKDEKWFKAFQNAARTKGMIDQVRGLHKEAESLS